jgi:hypothetical protein
MKRLLIICSLFLFFQCNKSDDDPQEPDTTGEQEGNLSEEQIEDVSGEQIAILGWYGIPSGEGSNERYQEMRLAGFTHNLPTFTTASYVEGSVLADLNFAHAAGMKTLIYAAMMDHPASFVKKLKEHPANGGYIVRDEPLESDFPTLAATVRKIQALDNEHPCYINHYPYGATGISNYANFIRTFIETVPVTFLSFDVYPVFVENGQRYVTQNFYQSLEIISSEARRANMPFWAFALATAHTGAYTYPSPTIDDLRLQVYSNLAYGAQCIQYFTYWTPPDAIFITGPIGKDGQKTDTYRLVQAMNNEIIALSKVFRNAVVTSVGHTGSIPPGGTIFENRPDVVKSFETTGGDGGALVSVLEKGNDKFFVVVNRSITNNMTVKIEGTDALRRIKKDGSAIIMGKGVKSFGVSPGDVLIFFWKK